MARKTMHDFSEDRNVGKLSEAIALEMGFTQSIARQLRFAAALHDIGKLRIPDSILEKPGKLTEEEFRVMKTHTYWGSKILSSVQGDFGVMVRKIALYHHECWDGSGYWGIYQNDLPEYVPIVSIADVYIALGSERPYKAAWPVERIIEYLNERAGIQFSRSLTDTFLSLVKRGNTLIL